MVWLSFHTQGGFIFPLFFAGASLGHALLSVTDDLVPPGLVAASPVLMCMCFAAGLNVAVTRTPFASPLILATLSGQPNIMAPALCAALASLFVTRSSKFIGPQRDRADIKYIGDLQPLARPSLQSALSTSPSSGDFEADRDGFGDGNNGNGGGGSAADAEMGSLLNGNGSASGYSAIPKPFTEHDVARAIEAALQTDSAE